MYTAHTEPVSSAPWAAASAIGVLEGWNFRLGLLMREGRARRRRVDGFACGNHRGYTIDRVSDKRMGGRYGGENGLVSRDSGEERGMRRGLDRQRAVCMVLVKCKELLIRTSAPTVTPAVTEGIEPVRA